MYRPKAIDLLIKAQAAKDQITRAECQRLALIYLRLSELARRYRQTGSEDTAPHQKGDGGKPDAGDAG
jgi:hypothetical protein